MEKKDTVISIKTIASLKEKLSEIAKAEHRSMAMQIELFLMDKITEWEETHQKSSAGKKK